MGVPIGWWLLAIGFCTGAMMGIQAQREEWLGGYAGRSRRLVRLGHIALIALGASNVARPLTTTAKPAPHASMIAIRFGMGGITMGPVCFLAAWCWTCRILLIVPSSSLIWGAILAGWGSLR